MSKSDIKHTVQAFVVLGDHGSATSELGLFYRATDADKHVASLRHGWANVRIEARQLALADVHPAHRSLFPDVTFPSTPTT